MKNICVIPARMGSSRFPGKPLHKILNKELVHHVYENCKKSNLFERILIATPDKEIKEFCSSIEADYIMTSNEHLRASDRCNEAILKLEKDGDNYDVITMVQGDEPLVTSETIDSVTKVVLNNKDILCANGFGDIKPNELDNKNCIKVMKDVFNDAIYMSRNSIPFNPLVNKNVGKQICVIPFKTEFLKKYSNLNETPLEVAESIDMLRIIEHGYKVRMVRVKGDFHPVDILNDVKIVEKFLSKNHNSGLIE